MIELDFWFTSPRITRWNSIMTATETVRMPRRKKRDDDVTKFDREVLRMARIVAAYRDIPLAEYLSEVVRPIVAQHLAEHQRSGGPPPTPPVDEPAPAGKRRKPGSSTS
jgi:hypothetical protein